MTPNQRQSIVGIIVAAVLAIVGVFIVDPLGDDRPTTTVNISPGVTATFDKDNKQTEGEAEDVKGADAHEDLRDETPPGVADESAKRGLSQKSAPGKGESVVLGGAQNYSCHRRLVVNRSSRNGQKVLLFVLHYTVSPFGSINGIFNQFNTRASGTSSHLGLELTGACQQWVNFLDKAWTEGNFNGRGESVEIVAPNDLPRQTWLNAAIFKEGILASIVYDRLRANGLPIRLVDPSGCGVQAAGYTDHNRLECGNSHTDVGRNFPFDVLNAQLRALSLGRPIGGGAKPPSEAAIRQCKTLIRVRRLNRPPPPGASHPARVQASRNKKNLRKRGYVCDERNHRVFIERR